MTWVVMKVGWVLQVMLGTTAAESMNASANIFLGQVQKEMFSKRRRCTLLFVKKRFNFFEF